MGFFKDKTEKLMREIVKLEPQEFIGVCKILGIKLVEEGDVEENVEGGDPKVESKARPFEDIWGDLCEKVNSLSRTQRRNLDKLVRAATKEQKKKDGSRTEV